MGKPRLIVIIRHAQSEGNRDKNIHQTTPDHKVGLTAEGHLQAREAGEKLRALLREDDNLHFFISPYRRTRQTTEGILSTLCADDPVPSPFQRSHVKVYEEPRLREQDFGNFQPGTEEVERLWKERANYGHFFYRIPNGESGADVYDRVVSFNGSLWRRFNEDSMASVAVIVTHGLCSRVFLMAWYHYSVEFFEDLRNINHCEFLVMKRARNSKYILQNRLRRWSDLKRERAERRSIDAASSPLPKIEVPPVRRWGSTKTRQHGTGQPVRIPHRQNTADMFRDEDEDEEERGEDLDNEVGAERPSASIDDPKKDLSTSPEYLRGALKKVAISEPSSQNPFLKARPMKAYLGRDGGGSRSGAASPLDVSDDEVSPDTRSGEGSVASPPTTSRTHSLPQRPAQPRSMAKAMRGELETDENRVFADALGDQSDAEVDAADEEVGTKERAKHEMQQILEEEKRERTHRGDVY